MSMKFKTICPKCKENLKGCTLGAIPIKRQNHWYSINTKFRTHIYVCPFCGGRLKTSGRELKYLLAVIPLIGFMLINDWFDIEFNSKYAIQIVLFVIASIGVLASAVFTEYVEDKD